MLTLRNFDTLIDPKIVERGEQYWQSGAVVKLKEQGPEEFIAHVRGTDMYQVRVVLDAEDVIEQACGCPYDKGEVCKHVVAVLYALADGERDIDGSQRNAKRTMQHTPSDDLENLSKEQLVAIVRDARTHADVGRRIAMTQATDASYEDKPFVKNIIRESLEEASDHWGGIDYGDTSDAIEGALEVMDVAESCVKTNLRAAVVIYEAVIEELAPTIARVDDSDGDIGGTIHDAFERLRECATARDTDDVLRGELFSYLMKEWPKKKYQGWDWPGMFLEIAADVVMTEEEEREFEHALATMLEYDRKERPEERGDIFSTLRKGARDDGTAFLDRFRREEIAKLHLRMLERLHPERVDAFLERHVDLHNMRERAIERHLASGNLSDARKLANEGAARAQKDGYPGLVIRYVEYLMHCAGKEGNSNEAGGYAIRLFLESHHDAFTYYRNAKEYAGTQWERMLADIIAKLSSRGKHGDIYKLAEVYIAEGMWDELLALVQKQPEMARTHGTRLEKRFPEETGRIYLTLAEEGIEHAGGRGGYSQKCQLLRDAKRLGCEREVDVVRARWLEQYPRRRALIEELAKV